MREGRLFYGRRKNGKTESKRDPEGLWTVKLFIDGSYVLEDQFSLTKTTTYRNTIFIMDRGYESYNTLAHVQEKGTFYLMRCKDINSNGILSGLKHLLPAEDIFDCKISITITSKGTKEAINHPKKYKIFYKKHT